MKIDKNKLDIAMARKCISMSEVADNAGIARSTVSAMRNGKVQIQPANIGKIARILEIDVTELLAE